MKLRLLFLLAYSCFERGHSDTNSSILTRLPELLKEYCTRSLGIPTERPIGRLPSCCTECSWESECAENGNCCFPYEHRLQHEDEDDLDVLQNGRSCLFPSTIQPLGTDRIYYQSYYMISSVPENIKGDRNISCGDENVAPWGSLYPIYSAKCNQIYKNVACVPVDCMNDSIHWEPVINCDLEIQAGIHLSRFVLALESNSIPDKCAVSFIYPGNIKDIRPFKCYDSLIDTCPESSNFGIPEGTAMSREDIVTMCTSGLVSPFRRMNMYANVFCHICNNEDFVKGLACLKIQDNGGRQIFTGFAGLIDHKFITDSRNETLEEGPDIPVACGIARRSTCRPVICSTGQLRDKAGSCMYPNKLWQNQDYIVIIKLTAQEAINITEVFQVPPRYVTRILPAFKSPWPEGWVIGDIRYEETDINRMSTHLAVGISNIITRIDPKHLMQNIKETIMREWVLEHNNVTIVFNSSFFPFMDLSSEWVFKNMCTSLTKPRYHWIYGRYIARRTPHLITELYVCDQVELNQSEFTLNLHETVLFNKITQRFMFDGQFILVSSITYKGIHARICIEDSGMYKTYKDAMLNTGVFRQVYYLRYIAAAVVFGVLYIVF